MTGTTGMIGGLTLLDCLARPEVGFSPVAPRARLP